MVIIRGLCFITYYVFLFFTIYEESLHGKVVKDKIEWFIRGQRYTEIAIVVLMTERLFNFFGWIINKQGDINIGAPGEGVLFIF